MQLVKFRDLKRGEINIMATQTTNYVDCDGVNVPADWTVEELRWALARRKTRFPNEKAIIAVFAAKTREESKRRRK